MGMKSEEALALKSDELADYLGAQHSAYMEYEGASYYLTDVNEHYWRVQDTTQLNDKGHYVDMTELVPSVQELLGMQFLDGKSILDVFDDAEFFASVK